MPSRYRSVNGSVRLTFDFTSKRAFRYTLAHIPFTTDDTLVEIIGDESQDAAVLSAAATELADRLRVPADFTDWNGGGQ